jgi:CheY-like chemotaxis protein
MSNRALVVDDCAVARSVMVILLQRCGWEVIGAADGVEALRLASSWHFDLVITLPEPSKVPGLQLLRILKGGLLSPEARVILQVEHVESAGRAGLLADGVLVKNGQVEKQLKSKLGELYGAADPGLVRKASRKRLARRRANCLSGKSASLRAGAIDG